MIAVALQRTAYWLYRRHYLIYDLLALDLDVFGDRLCSCIAALQILILLNIEIGLAEISGPLLQALWPLLPLLVTALHRLRMKSLRRYLECVVVSDE